MTARRRWDTSRSSGLKIRSSFVLATVAFLVVAVLIGEDDGEKKDYGEKAVLIAM